MIKTVGIVSLSSGILGESFVKHELELGIKRLKAYGLNVKFMPHALMGMEYIKNRPDKMGGGSSSGSARPGNRYDFVRNRR